MFYSSLFCCLFFGVRQSRLSETRLYGRALNIMSELEMDTDIYEHVPCTYFHAQTCQIWLQKFKKKILVSAIVSNYSSNEYLSQTYDPTASLAK